MAYCSLGSLYRTIQAEQPFQMIVILLSALIFLDRDISASSGGGGSVHQVKAWPGNHLPVACDQSECYPVTP